jgi:hypothetical protein
LVLDNLLEEHMLLWVVTIVRETELHTCNFAGVRMHIRNSKISVWQNPKRCFQQGPNQTRPVYSRKVRTFRKKCSQQTYWNREPHELMCTYFGKFARTLEHHPHYQIHANTSRLWSSSTRSTLEQRRYTPLSVYTADWLLLAKNWLWRERRTKIYHVNVEHGNKWSVQNIFKQNYMSTKLRKT